MRQVKDLYGPYTMVLQGSTETPLVGAGIAEGPFTMLCETITEWRTQGGVYDHELNALYQARSQFKFLSPGIDSFFDLQYGNQTNVQGVVNHMLLSNKKRWLELWDTMFYEYNPINNYDMEEKLINDIKELERGTTRTRTDNLTDQITYASQDQLTHATSDTLTLNTTDTLTHDTTDETTHATTDTTTYNTEEERTPALQTTDKVYGFNSNSAVNSAEQSATGTETNAKTGTETLGKTGKETDKKTGTETDRKTGTETSAKTGTETNAKTGNDTRTNTGTQTDAMTGSDTETRNYTLTRKGNIGVTTSQQMIQSQRDLWIWDYFDIIMSDIDKVLTLSVY